MIRIIVKIAAFKSTNIRLHYMLAPEIEIHKDFLEERCETKGWPGRTVVPSEFLCAQGPGFGTCSDEK